MKSLKASGKIKDYRLVIVDTKPRWRATISLTGKSLRSRYKGMAPGDVIPGVVLSNSKDWGLVWDQELNPYRTVIVQNDSLEEDQLVAWCNSVIRKTFESQDFKIPTLIYIDEVMDFFGENGTSRYGDAIRRCYRGGREKNLSTLSGSQRPKQIGLQVVTESNILYLFHIAYDEDLKRLYEMGWPRGEVSPPQKSHAFKMMRDGELYPGLLRVKV